jgi:hypothetical protein
MAKLFHSYILNNIDITHLSISLLIDSWMLFVHAIKSTFLILSILDCTHLSISLLILFVWPFSVSDKYFRLLNLVALSLSLHTKFPPIFDQDLMESALVSNVLACLVAGPEEGKALHC